MKSKYGPNREDFRRFSTMKKYVGYWMGKIYCQRAVRAVSVSTYGKVMVRMCRKNYVILELPGEEYTLKVTLFRTKQSARSSQTGERTKRLQASEWKDLQQTEIGRHVFTAEEILNFVISIEDTNEIHRTADPVVPGFQMMEWFLTFLSAEDWHTWEIRFHGPALAGQELCLCSCSGGYQCILAETGELLWDCCVEKT